MQAYQYFNWRRDSTNDLVLFVVINFSLLIMGSVIKVRELRVTSSCSTRKNT